MARAAAAVGQARRRHPRPCAGERGRRRPWRRSAPRSSSFPRSGSCRGSTPPRSTDAVEALHTLRARLPHEPERRPPPVRGDGRRRPRRPGAGERDRRRDRPRDRGRAARARRDRRRRPGALRRRGAGRGPRGSSTSRASPRWSRARPRPATCSRTPFASAAPAVDVVALYETVAEDPRSGRGRGRPRGGLRDLHLVLDGAQLRRGGRRRARARSARRLDRAGHQRDRPRSRARGRTSRPSATTPRGSSRRWWPTRGPRRWLVPVPISH